MSPRRQACGCVTRCHVVWVRNVESAVSTGSSRDSARSTTGVGWCSPLAVTGPRWLVVLRAPGGGHRGPQDERPSRPVGVRVAGGGATPERLGAEGWWSSLIGHQQDSTLV